MNDPAIRVCTFLPDRPLDLAEAEHVRLMVNSDGTITIRLERKDYTRYMDLATFTRVDFEDAVTRSKEVTAQDAALANFKNCPIQAIKVIRDMTKCNLVTAKRIVDAFAKGAD
jgi:hypothetical protein